MAISMKLLPIMLLALSSMDSIVNAQQSAPHPQQPQPFQLDPQCLNCICHASSDCQANIKCHNAGPEQYYCGPYQISWAYWADGGKPGNTGQSDDFEKCLVDKSCAEIAIHGYMNRYGHDCNGDGRLDCFDFAAIHKAGPSVSGCKQNWLLESKYWSKFLQCYNGQSSSNNSSLPSSEHSFQPQPINHQPSNSFQAPPNNQPSSFQPNNHQPINSFQPNPNYKPTNNIQQPTTNHQPQNSFTNNHQPSNSFKPNSNRPNNSNNKPSSSNYKPKNIQPASTNRQPEDFLPDSNNQSPNSYQPFNNQRPSSYNRQPEDFKPDSNDQSPHSYQPSNNQRSSSNNRQPEDFQPNFNNESPNSYQPSNNRKPSSNNHQPENFQPNFNNESPNSYQPSNNHHPENIQPNFNNESPNSYQPSNNRRPSSNNHQPENFQPDSNNQSPNSYQPSNNRQPNLNNQSPNSYNPSNNRQPNSNNQSPNSYKPSNNPRPSSNNHHPENIQPNFNNESPNSYQPSNNQRPSSNNRQPEDFQPDSNNQSPNSYQPSNNRQPNSNNQSPNSYNPSNNQRPSSNNHHSENIQPNFDNESPNSYEHTENNNREPINNYDQPEDFHPLPNNGPQNSYQPSHNGNNHQPTNNHNQPEDSHSSPNNGSQNHYKPSHDNRKPPNNKPIRKNNVPVNLYEPNHVIPHLSDSTRNNQSSNPYEENSHNLQPPNLPPNEPTNEANSNQPSINSDNISTNIESPNSFDDSPKDYHQPNQPIRTDSRPSNSLNDIPDESPNSYDDSITHRQDEPNNHHQPGNSLHDTTTNQPPHENSTIDNLVSTSTMIEIPRIPRTTLTIPRLPRLQLPSVTASASVPGASASASAGFDGSGTPVTFASTSTNDDSFDLGEFTRSFPNPLNTNFHSIITNTLNKPFNFRQPPGFNRNGFSLNNNRFNHRPLPAPLPPPSAPRSRPNSVSLPPQPSTPPLLSSVNTQPSFLSPEHNNSGQPSSPKPSEIEHENNEEPISKSCFNCLCQASTKCELNKGCDGAYCGPYLLSWGYWADGGQPGNDYVICTKQKYCSERAIKGYMEKWKRDCNGDGIIDCTDYAMIHKLGPHGCARIQALQGTEYWNQFTQCNSKSNKPSRSPIVFDLPLRSSNELPSNGPTSRSIRPNLIENSIVLKPGNRIRINNRGEILNNQPNSLREIPKPIRPTEPPRTRIDLSYFNQSRPIIIRIKPPIANDNLPQTPPIPNLLPPTPPSPPLPGPLRPSLRPTPVQPPSPTPVRNEVIEIKPLNENNNDNYFTEPRPSEHENKPSNVFEIPRRSSNDEEAPIRPLVPSPKRNNITSSTNELIGQECMECICYASSKCSNSIGCRSELGGKHVCGPYQINWEYWAEAGKPGNRGDLSGLENFQMCANNRECADQTVRDYITRWRKDCNEDGVIDCNDFAALHVAGPNQCDASWYAESKYYSDFRECYDF